MIEDDDETQKQAEADDDFHIKQPELKIRSSQAALYIVDDLSSFCETLGHANLVSALNLVTRRLETMVSEMFWRLKNVSQKKQLNILTKLFNLIVYDTSDAIKKKKKMKS